MPLRTFWSYNRNVDRIRAEGEQRQLRLLGAAQSAEGSKALEQQLNEELDSPVLVEKTFDAAKYRELQERFRSGA